MLAAEDARSITLSYNYAGASYDIVADFGAKGTWKRSDNTWTELTAAAPSAEISDKMAVLNAVGTPGQSAPNGYTFSRALSGCPSNRRLGSAIWK
jgi:hypothetical protein